MTHTLHRQGAPEGLRQDCVVFTMSAKKINSQGSAEKMKKFFEIAEKHNPVNYGDMKTGNRFQVGREEIYDNIQDTSIVHFVFIDQAAVDRLIAELKAVDLGLSIIVSGLVETTEKVCRLCGLKMHTVEFSGGVMGRVEKLSSPEVTEVTTMCGHGMVAQNLVKDMAKQVRKGKKTLEEAGVELAKPCVCGVFNPQRAEELLKKMI